MSLCFFIEYTNRLLGFELVSQGTLDTVLMPPRDVLRLATIHNASAIAIAHNHPSGDSSPSDGDIQATRQLFRAAQHLGVELLDHIIIGDARRKQSYTSLRWLECFSNDSPAELDKKSIQNSLTELEFAKNQSNTMLQLLADNMDYQNKNGHWREEFGDSMCAGVCELVSGTRERLTNAFNKTFQAIHPKCQSADGGVQ